MASTTDLAVLALRVYSTPSAIDPNPLTRDAEKNRPAVPTGWTELEWRADNGKGFSYGVYQNGNEIVISYAGTNEGIDWVSNSTNGLGLSSAQTTEAALVYLSAKQQYGSNISFTGHSLGGGLASVMAVWFDRPAVVFDQAPFELTARNPLVIGATYGALTLAGFNVGAFAGYTGLFDFSAREAKVSNYFTQDEALLYARLAWPTIVGPTDEVIVANVTDMTSVGAKVDLHSQALLVALQMSQKFQTATYVSSRVLPLLMDEHLYAYSTKSSTENVLINFIRSEQSATAGQGKLTHFAADLQKLGTNIAGLNAAAQHAIIAQGIEWYYWQGTDYAGKEFLAQTGSLLQYTTARGDGLEGAQNKAGIYTAGWLASLQNDNGAAYSPILRVDYEQWNISAGNSGVTATAKDASKNQVFIGGGGVDNFTGGDKADTLLGGAGDDKLNGGAGNDVLFGGANSDTYSFKDAFGKDTITDSDGQGTIQIDGQTIGTAKGAGKRGVWVAEVGAGQYVGLSVYDNQSSTTGKKLVITRAGSTDNTISIDNFDLAKALSSEGYLGIKLDPTQRVALVQGTGSEVGASTSNVWSDNTFKASSLEGQSSEVVEANGKSFNIYLAQAAHAGDTLTLSLDGALASEFKAQIDGVIVDADGAVITLTEGQTSVSFSLLEDGEITADMAGSISASYAGTDPNNSQTAESNTWALNLQDTGEIARTYTGDQRGPITVNLATGVESYDWSPTSWANDGTLIGGEAEPDFADVIYARSGNDKIDGNGGNDALSGGAGNDQIDGGEGADMIAGGTGSDNIQGGAGDDFISSSAALFVPQRKKPTDSWSPPAGQEVKVSSATWGVYLDEQGGSKVTVWAGIGETDTGGTEGDAVDGGAGNDVLEGGDGDDVISADGITKEGYLNSVAAGSHGADFVDGGAGKDNLNGGGKDDQLFGGDKDDILYGGNKHRPYAMNSIASCAHPTRARGQFGYKSRYQSQSTLMINSASDPYGYCARSYQKHSNAMKENL